MVFLIERGLTLNAIVRRVRFARYKGVQLLDQPAPKMPKGQPAHAAIVFIGNYIEPRLINRVCRRRNNCSNGQPQAPR